MGAQHMPGEEVWLVGEHRSGGERKYYLANLPADTPIKKLAGALKARWICEQAHQELKEELGLDHFEGRSWIGLHRHALMTMIAYAFLQSRRLAAAGRKKKESPGRRRSLACPPSARRSSTISPGRRQYAVRIAAPPYATTPPPICQSSASKAASQLRMGGNQHLWEDNELLSHAWSGGRRGQLFLAVKYSDGKTAGIPAQMALLGFSLGVTFGSQTLDNIVELPPSDQATVQKVQDCLQKLSDRMTAVLQQ